MERGNNGSAGVTGMGVKYWVARRKSWMVGWREYAGDDEGTGTSQSGQLEAMRVREVTRGHRQSFEMRSGRA